jgi:hypothetical protein
VIGIVVAVLLVGAAFAVTLVVAGRGDDDPAEATSSRPTAATSSPTDETSTPSATAPSTAPGTAATDVVGDGYGYDLPAPGWKDASQDAQRLAPTIDTAIILGSSIDLSQSSIIVEALSSGSASSVDDLADLWKRNLSSTDNATPVDIAETTIAGERAIGVRIEDRVNNAGIPITQVAYLALHDGRQYSVGLSFPQEGDAISEGDFATMLDSWSWTS